MCCQSGLMSRQGVFNSLRMNLWVIRSGWENPCRVNARHPSCEIAPEELSSTLSRAAFPLVRGQLSALGRW
jgi:hypothetical protein